MKNFLAVAFLVVVVHPSGSIAQTISGSANGRGNAPTDWLSSWGGGFGTTDVLSDVSCASSAFCLAVGSTTTAGLTEGLYATHVVTSSGTNSDTDSVAAGILSGVSCLSSIDCMVVGYRYDGTLPGHRPVALRWQGVSNPFPTLPMPVIGSDTFLRDVHCVDATQCIAVGSYSDGNSHPLVLNWDGVTWSVESNFPTPTRPEYLTGVSCTSATHCFAVGSGFSGNSWDGSIWEMNGGSWSHVTSFQIGSGGITTFNAVACVPSTCYLVGVGSGKAIAAKWSAGSTWALNGVATPGVGSSLQSVACTPVRKTVDCRAVGGYQDVSGVWFNLVETLGPRDSWRQQSIANFSTTYNFLTAVAAANGQPIVAAGRYEIPSQVGPAQIVTHFWIPR